MADGRLCAGPGCENSLTGTKRQKFCSTACRTRAARHRNSDGPRTVGAVVEDEAIPATQELLRSELRPVVREAITAEVVDAIHKLVGSLPAAVEAAARDVNSEDPELRQRAYALILRYTVGNQAVTPDISGEKAQPLTVHFNLPRPTANGVEGDPERSGVIESKECDSCHVTKTLDQFEGSSDRCQECFGLMRDRAAALLGTEAVVQDAG